MAAVARVPSTRTLNPPKPVTLTVAEKRALAVAAYTRFGRGRSLALTQVEGVDEALLRTHTTDRTILAIAVRALHDAGIQGNRDVDFIMRELDMSPDDVNTAFCICQNGRQMSGHIAAERVAALD